VQALDGWVPFQRSALDDFGVTAEQRDAQVLFSFRPRRERAMHIGSGIVVAPPKPTHSLAFGIEASKNRDRDRADGLEFATGFAVEPSRHHAISFTTSHITRPPLIIEKNGGLNNTTSYIGMMPGEKLGILILSNRGSNNAGARIGRRIMLGLVALSSAEAQRTGARN
jgi:hypothetical protein